MWILSLAVEEDSDQRLMIGAGKWVQRIGLLILALGLFCLGLFPYLLIEFRHYWFVFFPGWQIGDLTVVSLLICVVGVPSGLILTYGLGRWIFDREEKKLHRFRPFRRIQTWSFDEIERVEIWQRRWSFFSPRPWQRHWQECYLVLKDDRRISLNFSFMVSRLLPVRIAQVVGVPLVEQKVV